jgi:FAD/FMN-containing dehydrogenase
MPSHNALNRLRSRLSSGGRLLRPGDAGYDEERLLLNRSYDPRPAVIVCCATPEDVALTIRFAREAELPLAIRSGGTSPAGHSANTGGVLLDLARMNTIAISPDRTAVEVGPGAKMGALYGTLGPTNLMVPLGECMQVGAGGLSLGGGFSLLSRSLGLTCDNLLQAEVVLADGKTVTASPTEHPDLFWALRGAGGGNFGVVTSLRFRLHALEPSLYAGMVIWPIAQATEVLSTALAYFADDAPPELNAVFMLSPLPPPSTEKALATVALYNGPAAVGAPLVEKVTGLGRPSQASVGPQPYATFVSRDFPSLADIHDYYKSGFITGALPEEGVRLLVDRFCDTAAAPAVSAEGLRPANAVGFELAGGVINGVAPDATAFVHRTHSALVSFLATWHGPRGTTDRAEIRWADSLHGEMQPYWSGGTYQNYPDPSLPDPLPAYYGGNLRRLREIKRDYDPDEVFRFPQGIRPFP